MKKLLLFLVVLVAVSAGLKAMLAGDTPLMRSSGMLENPYPPGSPLHAQQQEFVDQFNADPKLRERFAGDFTSKGLYAEVSGALQRGARSLDSGQLVTVTRAMAAVIPRLQPSNCAKLIRPRDDFDPVFANDFGAALERLPPRHHRNFWNFYLSALKAEVHGLPERREVPGARERAFQELGSRFHGPSGQRLANVMRNPRGAADADACWAINTLIHTSTQLSPDHTEALARAIWSGR